MTLKAARLPRHRGPAAWSAFLPDRTATPPLESELTADVVIVGAGFAGLSAARRLLELEPTASVVLLDAGEIAEGAAGRNSGFMIDIPHELTSADYAGAGDDQAQITLNRAAQSFAAAAVEAYQIPAAYFDRAGKINGAASPSGMAHNASFSKHLEALGEPFEKLDAAQMAEVTGSHYYSGGLYTPGTVMLQPAGYVQGLASGLVTDGIRLFERSPVTGIVRQGSDWKVKTASGSVSTRAVILTVNGHLESFGIAQRRLMHVMLFAVATPDLSGRLPGASRWGVTPSDPMGTTVRRIDTAQGGNRIITRTCATFRPDMEATPADLARAKRVMQRKFDARFPNLRGTAMEYAWAGHLCLTQNGSSVTGEVAPGVYSGCVQNGLGTARGTLTGIAAAEMCLGHQSAISHHFAAEPKPAKLPPRPIAQLGASATLRWREWRARAE